MSLQIFVFALVTVVALVVMASQPMIWRTEARRLGLEQVSRGIFRRAWQGQIPGGHVVRIETMPKTGLVRHSLVMAEIRVTPQRALPQPFSIVTNGPHTKAKGSFGVRVHEPAFDVRFGVTGEEQHALSVLSGPMRALLQAGSRAPAKNVFGVSNGGFVGRSLMPIFGGRAREMVETAQRLVECWSELPEGSAERLAINVTSDPVDHVRARSLEILVSSFPASEVTKQAVELALESEEPRMRLVAASCVHDSEQLDALARGGAVPDDVRLGAMKHLAASDSTRCRLLCRELLTDDAGVTSAAVRKQAAAWLRTQADGDESGMLSMTDDAVPDGGLSLSGDRGSMALVSGDSQIAIDPPEPGATHVPAHDPLPATVSESRAPATTISRPALALKVAGAIFVLPWLIGGLGGLLTPGGSVGAEVFGTVLGLGLAIIIFEFVATSERWVVDHEQAEIRYVVRGLVRRRVRRFAMPDISAVAISSQGLGSKRQHTLQLVGPKGEWRINSRGIQGNKHLEVAEQLSNALDVPLHRI